MSVIRIFVNYRVSGSTPVPGATKRTSGGALPGAILEDCGKYAGVAWATRGASKQSNLCHKGDLHIWKQYESHRRRFEE